MKTLEEIWELAHKNTISKPRGYFSYVQVCNECDCETEYESTDNRQQIGNVIQSIVQCNECNNHFVIEWVFNQP